LLFTDKLELLGKISAKLAGFRVDKVSADVVNYVQSAKAQGESITLLSEFAHNQKE